MSYFPDLFKSAAANGRLSDREIVNQVTGRDNTELVTELTHEEVKQAVFSMYPDKSPGIDGLNPVFFQTYWSIVGRDVVKFCQDYIRNGELLNGINQTLICLIPKIKVPQDMTDLRPISLYNVLVRILSKVLVNRLKSCLKRLISDKQNVFIKGGLLNDNVLIAFEVNHYLRRLSQGSNGIAGLKLDILKAYGRLEWDFIRTMMMRFGFSNLCTDSFIRLITSVSYSFIQNEMCLKSFYMGEFVKAILYLLMCILCVRRDLVL